MPTGPIGYSPDHIDRSVSPRQDFYRYATGNWLDRLTIPDAEGDISGFSHAGGQTSTNSCCSWPLKASQASAPKGSPEQQVGDYYPRRHGQRRARMRSASSPDPGGPGLRPAKASGPADLARLSARLQASTPVRRRW